MVYSWKRNKQKKNNKNKVKMTEIIILQTDCQCLNKGNNFAQQIQTSYKFYWSDGKGLAVGNQQIFASQDEE